MLFDLPDNLCNTCTSLFGPHAEWGTEYHISEDKFIDNGPEFPSRGSKFYQVVGSMRVNAAEGCHLCTLVLAAVEETAKSTLDLMKVPNQTTGIELVAVDEDHVRRMSADISLIIHIAEWEGVLYQAGPVYLLRVFAKAADGISLFLLANIEMESQESEPEKRYIPASSTSSRATLDQVKEWLDFCTSDHEPCNLKHGIGTSGSTRPTRLLDLSQLDSDLIKLVYSRDLPQTIEWMTLSHRWGKSPVITLTFETESELTTFFPLDKLPPLFQDTVKLAHKLGCQYFWIDTLCIRQNDPEDWLHEATAMGEVYARSLLNISASQSSHNSSLYCPRNPLLLTDLIIKPTWTCFPAKFLVVGAEGHGGAPLKGEPLLSRGWVFQERLLAPRVLHFGAKQVVWECREHAFCELDPDALLYSNLYGFQKHSSRIFLTQEGPKAAAEVLSFWMDKLEEYSQTETTFEEDRLLALAGIADYISGLTKSMLGKYYVGSWEFGMVSQLAWAADCIKPGEQPPTALAKYRAPSWSWAKISGSFASGRDLGGGDVNRELAMIHQISVKPVRSPYGPASEGSIQLWGNLCEIRVLPNSTQLRGDAIKLFPLPEDLDLEELEKDFAAKLEIQKQRPPTIELFDPRARHRAEDQEKDPHQEYMACQQIIELDHITFSRQGIYWDNAIPSSSQQNLENRKFYILPIVLRTQKDSVWEEEISLLTDDSNPCKDPRDVGNDGFLHYLLTDRRLFQPRSTDEEKLVDLRNPLLQKCYDSQKSHDIDALILEPIEGEGPKGKFKRVASVSMGSMVYSPTSRRQRQGRETGRMIADVMKRSRLEEERCLVYDEVNSVYLVEII